ncbi:MAG TPA: hypothetical protein VEB88_02190 [Candidatus Acidoferrales bacterium]|nr:hypothetical protein [Candidatus Acidoferrales bacterium]
MRKRLPDDDFNDVDVERRDFHVFYFFNITDRRGRERKLHVRKLETDRAEIIDAVTGENYSADIKKT